MIKFHFKKTNYKEDGFFGYIISTTNFKILLEHNVVLIRLNPNVFENLFNAYKFEDAQEYHCTDLTKTANIVLDIINDNQLDKNDYYLLIKDFFTDLSRISNSFARKPYLFEYNDDLFIYESLINYYIIQINKEKKGFFKKNKYKAIINIYNKETKKVEHVVFEDIKLDIIQNDFKMISYLYQNSFHDEGLMDIIEKDYLYNLGE